MKTSKTTFALALTATLGAAGIAHAAGSPFELKPMSHGYRVAAADMPADAKTPEGKCGGAKEAKAKEGKCGAMKEAKHKEGKCGEGKCGNKGTKK